jgi:hypothetical protein
VQFVLLYTPLPESGNGCDGEDPSPWRHDHRLVYGGSRGGRGREEDGTAEGRRTDAEDRVVDSDASSGCKRALAAGHSAGRLERLGLEERAGLSTPVEVERSEVTESDAACP